jgi:N-formylglutamate amidohydrolase
VEQVLRGAGYRVQRNKPYAGGFITEHYGNPAIGWHALQIEVNRALYMDEKTLERKSHYDQLRRDLTCVAMSLAVAIASTATDWQAAAE